MDTPICDFVRRYGEKKELRLHMPGHKGTGPLGIEALDITEIDGADSLYEACGIIRESEENAAKLFGCPTFYSTEGSSHCIRAMLYLCLLYGKAKGKKPVIAAGRNAHKAFLSAAALLDLQIRWLWPEDPDSYLSCKLREEDLEKALASMDETPVAVYLTSPDYLGNMADIPAMARVCRRHGVLLLVDNAHGAYLKFLQPSRHPMDLGADLCCDSAHKTLPVLTGGAYLHIRKDAPALFFQQVRSALALFGSTSPSYLILQSLDAANARLAGDYSRDLAATVRDLQTLENRLTGYCLRGEEPLKLTLFTKPYGYEGCDFSRLLQEKGIVSEFSDPDHVVLMLTPETGEAGIRRLESALMEIPQRPAIRTNPPRMSCPRQEMSVRTAVFSPCRVIPASESAGRILARSSVGCPPAVPIVVSGERIDADAVESFRYYGITQCAVVEE